jgi:hypothetical protein
MSKFQVQGGSVAPDVLKFTAGGWEGPVLQKDSIEANMDDVNRRVTQRTGDGAVLDAARQIARVYRQTIAPNTGVSTLTVTERKALRDRIVAAMTQEQGSPFVDDHSKPTPALIAIASLLAGLTDELEATEKSAFGKATELAAFKSQVRGKISELQSLVLTLQSQRAGASFDSSGNLAASKSVTVPSGGTRTFRANG